MVANEVKGLAHETSDATGGVSERIHEIETVGHSVEATMTRLLDEVRTLSVRQKDVLQNLVAQQHAVTLVVEQTARIADRMRDAGGTFTELRDSVTAVDELSSTFGSAANTLHVLAAEMSPAGVGG